MVVDRGMAFEENLRQLKERKLHCVVATRQSERDASLGISRMKRDLKKFTLTRHH